MLPPATERDLELDQLPPATGEDLELDLLLLAQGIEDLGRRGRGHGSATRHLGARPFLFPILFARIRTLSSLFPSAVALVVI